MNGRYLLDTNTVIALLKGNEKIRDWLEEANWVGISIITYLEFLAFSNLTETDKNLFLSFVERVEVIGLDMDHHELLDTTLSIRETKKLKLPDAIIAATTLTQDATLISADGAFSKIAQLRSLTY